MWWAVGLYFVIGAMAAFGGYDPQNYDRKRTAMGTFFLWPLFMQSK